jgi:hypothetical protein
MKAKACCVSAALLTSLAVPAAAHHSFAMFDRDKTVEVQGTVKAFQWTNPHSFLDVYVNDPKDGAPVLWTFEFGAVHNLVNQGWKPKTVVPGDKILLTLHPAKNGGPYGQALTVTLPNGTVMQAIQGILPSELGSSDANP